MKKVIALAAASIAALATAAAAVAATVVVQPFNMDGWSNQSDGTASVTFVTGPGTPPAGVGSAELRVGADGNSGAKLVNSTFAHTPLANLTTLTYSTYVQGGGSGGQAPYIILAVDYHDEHVADDLLFFEPVYQTAEYCPSNPQPAVAVGAWQQWDARNGCWWSLNGTAGATPGTGVKPLSAILAAQPQAALAGTDALRLVAGFGAPNWNNFVGNADKLTVGVSGQNTTYDFEPDIKPAKKADCKKGGWKRFNAPPFKNQGECIAWVKSHS